jgi:CBS domain-containing protein
MSPSAAETVRLAVDTDTAENLMTSNPVSIREGAGIAEAIALLTGRDMGAAPVINEAGQPVGVVSRADILIHQREQPPAETREQDRSLVRDIMTPVIFSVMPDTPAAKVINEMVALNVHQLFVVGRDGVLIGTINAFDILKHLFPR